MTDARCQFCGYSLQGLPGAEICPECGKSPDTPRYPEAAWALWVFRIGRSVAIAAGVAWVALQSIPLFIPVFHRPNGSSPNDWWWEFYWKLSAYTLFGGLGLMAAAMSVTGRLRPRRQAILLTGGALMVLAALFL